MVKRSANPLSDSGTADLLSRMIADIKQNGPLSLASYITYALADPDEGYYQTKDPLGGAGDFTTAPEISGLFGEMCGLYLAHMAEIFGTDNAAVIELGPGRGSLMADMRHVWQRLMPALAAAPLHFVETSPHLRQLQRKKLGDVEITFHANLDHLPPQPLFAVANEFFDALPIAQAVWRRGDADGGVSGAWHHRLVGLTDGRLAFVDGPPLAPDDLAAWALDAMPTTARTDGDIVEFCPMAEAYVKKLAHHLATFGGACLVIDYGRDGQTGDSLQAVARHRPVDVFHQPGTADLSHWVDFSALRRVATAAGARLVGPVPQGDFLRETGIMQRAESAARFADAETRRGLYAAVDRLVSGQHMGSAFKVALLVPAGDGIPAGFTPSPDQEDGT